MSSFGVVLADGYVLDDGLVTRVAAAIGGVVAEARLRIAGFSVPGVPCAE